MSQLTLAKAKEILPKYTTEDHLFTHAMAVSAAMGAMADYFHADKDHWEAIGYLHDVDYEKYPNEHCHHVREFLEPEGGRYQYHHFPWLGHLRQRRGTHHGHREEPFHSR